ncbi:MAG: DUF2007 domain-containing protein, partial [Flavobacteriaceae bacterium]|nr:DUF2007 domain-containing protein [Flavobacteriaceae bacterium]
MNHNYTVLSVFEYSTESYVVKTKLDSEGIRTMLMDEKTIDSDPLISQAIGGVKLLVHKNDLEKATIIYNQIRVYVKDDKGEDLNCVSCGSTQILVAPLKRKNLFFMLFPFFERRRF